MLGDKLTQGIVPGVSGTLVGNKVVTAVAGGGTSVPTVGDYFLTAMGANLICEVLDDAGVWATLYAQGAGGLITTDGVVVRIRNVGVASQNYSTQKLG